MSGEDEDADAGKEVVFVFADDGDDDDDDAIIVEVYRKKSEEFQENKRN